MASIKTRLLIFIILLSASSCICVKPVSLVEIEAVDVVERVGNRATLQVKLKIENPNNYKIKITKYDLEGSVNKRSMGALDVQDRIIIPKNSRQSHTVKISSDISPLLMSLPVIMITRSATLGLQGTITARVFGIIRRKVKVDESERVSAEDIGF